MESLFIAPQRPISALSESRFPNNTQGIKIMESATRPANASARSMPETASRGEVSAPRSWQAAEFVEPLVLALMVSGAALILCVVIAELVRH